MNPVCRCRPLLTKSCLSIPHSSLPLPFPPVYVRSLATVSPPTPRRPETTFTDTLNSGPSFSDFLGSSTPESLPGSSHLPEWLKRPIPAGGNFAKIKKDLRGLNLHTGIEFLEVFFWPLLRGVCYLPSLPIYPFRCVSAGISSLPLCPWNQSPLCEACGFSVDCVYGSLRKCSLSKYRRLLGRLR